MLIWVRTDNKHFFIREYDEFHKTSNNIIRFTALVVSVL